MSSQKGTTPSPNLIALLFFGFKIIPAALSGMSIYLGYKLFIMGVTGEATLVVNSESINGQLLNAAPGLFFAIGGVAGLIISIMKGAPISFDAGSTTGRPSRGSINVLGQNIMANMPKRSDGE